MTSLWTLAPEKTTYPSLDQDTDADVVILGAGITGLSTAIRLADAGRSVVVLEARSVGAGSTGGSTGNLYSTLSGGLTTVYEKWDTAMLRTVIDARRRAVDAIEQLVERFDIDCEFHRRPLYRLVSADDELALRTLGRERALHETAGYVVQPADITLGTLTFQDGFMLADQAQFNPFAYLQGLAAAASALGVRIFEHSPAESMRRRGQTVHTAHAAVHARHVVHATHTPKGVHLSQTMMVPSLEYGTAARTQSEAGGEGIFWIADDQVSLRGYRHGDDFYLLAVGEKHKTGEHGDAVNHHEILYRYLAKRFPDVSAPTHGWSAQQFKAPDGLPLIGPSPMAEEHYIATGFAADGLVWGMVAAEVITAHINGETVPYDDAFSARRFTPLKSASSWAEESVHAGKHMIMDHLSHQDELDDLAPGSGRVVRHEGNKLAVYRDPQGDLTALSAICPHLKCVVHWNHSAGTWDCPCHGSRFDIHGKVLDGPACDALKPMNI